MPAASATVAAPAVGQLPQLAAHDHSPSSPLTKVTQQSPAMHGCDNHDDPVVPTAAVTSYVAWDALVDDEDRDVEGWPEYDAEADTNHAPVVGTPISFVEACKRGVPEEVLTGAHKPTADSMASVDRQRLSARTLNASAAAPRPQTAADAGWHTVGRKQGSRSPKRASAASKKGQDAAQAAAVGRSIAPARVQPAADTNSGGAERSVLTKSRKKRQAEEDGTTAARQLICAVLMSVLLLSLFTFRKCCCTQAAVLFA